MPVVHAKVSGITDVADTTLVRPSDWNAGHVVVVNLATEVTGVLPAANFDKTGDWTGTFDSQEGSYYLNYNNLTNKPAPVTAHSALTGLTTGDDHTQYALLAGRSGGQTLIGGTGITDNLILRTTSGNATTGADIIFQCGNNGATEIARFTQLNQKLLLGNMGGDSKLHVVNTSSGATSLGFALGNAATANNTGVRFGFNLSTSNTAYQSYIDAIRTNSPAGGATKLVFGTHNGTSAADRMTLSEAGNLSVTGTASASNLSGTNTGDITILDSSSIDFTLTGQQITAAVFPAGVDHNSLANLITGDPHTQYTLLAGRSGGQSLSGGSAANDDLTLQGTTNATRATSYVLLQPNGGNTGIGGITSPTEKLENGGFYKSGIVAIGQASNSSPSGNTNFVNFGCDGNASLLLGQNLYISGSNALKVSNTHGALSGAAITIPGNGQAGQGSVNIWTTPSASVTAGNAYTTITPRIKIDTDGQVYFNQGTTDFARVSQQAGGGVALITYGAAGVKSAGLFSAAAGAVFAYDNGGFFAIQGESSSNFSGNTLGGGTVNFRIEGDGKAGFLHGLTVGYSLPTTPPTDGLAVNGIVTVRDGLSSSVAKVGGTIFDHFADAGNSTTAETDLYSDTIPASALGSNSDKLEAEYGGAFISSGTATRQVRMYFGGSLVFDTGTLTLSLSSAWTVYLMIIRVSSSVVRYLVSFSTQGAALSAYTSAGEVTGLTLANSNILKITGQAAGVGAATNDIIAKLGTISWQPAA